MDTCSIRNGFSDDPELRYTKNPKTQERVRKGLRKSILFDRKQVFGRESKYPTATQVYRSRCQLGPSDPFGE